MSARIVLVLDAGASTIEYALVDVDRGRVLADGLVDGLVAPDAAVTHTVHFFAEPGEPAPTVLSATARTAVAVEGPDASIRALLDQFAQHGPALEQDIPAAVAHRSSGVDLRAAVAAALPGIPQAPAPAADSPLQAAREVIGLI